MAVTLATPTDTRCFVAITTRGDEHSCDLPFALWRSDDAGATWREVLTSESLVANTLTFSGESGWLDAERQCAGVLPEPYRTDDGGVTWRPAGDAAPSGPADQAATPSCRVVEGGQGFVIERRDGALWRPAVSLRKKWPSEP